jgi:hypothetical protein
MLSDVSLASRMKQQKPRARLADRLSGAVGQQGSGLPLMLPGPRQAPKFIVDPTEGDGDPNAMGGAANYLDLHEVRSRMPLDRQSKAHEEFHTFDFDQLTLKDRMRLAQIVAPRRAASVTSDDAWWGETGAEAGGHAGIAEIAADYYAAARTGRKLRRKRPGGITLVDQAAAYGDLRPRRLRGFRVFMDEWARAEQAKARVPGG